MTGKRISDLDGIALPLTLAEILPAVQNGATGQISLEQVRGGRIVSIRDFGAIGDGVTDDTAAFRALNSQLRQEQASDPELRIVITLPPGHYRYTWNRWLWGLRDVTVLGYGARLQCVSSSAWNFNKFALVTNRNGLQSVALDEEVPPHTVNVGCLIGTAGPGARTVQLKTPDEAVRFQPGRFVLIMSYDQQFGGYPPNCRYFDYAKVIDVNGPVISLDRPLRHFHQDDYPELNADSISRARIVDIDREDVPLAYRQTLFGLTTLPNPNIGENSAQYVLAQGVNSFIARDCNFVAFVASIGMNFSIENSKLDFCEPDKLAEAVNISRCQIGSLTQATGANLVYARECSFVAKANVQSRVANFDGCTFNGACQPGDYQRGIDLVGFAPSKAINVVNSLFYGKNGATDTAIGPVGTPINGFASISLEAPIQLLNNEILVIPKKDKRAQTLLQSVDLFDYVWFGAQTGGELYCDGRYGVIQSIRATEQAVLIELSLSAPVTSKDMLFVPRTQRFRSAGNGYTAIASDAPVSCVSNLEDVVINSQRFSFRLSSNFSEMTKSVTGFLKSISVRVLRPYTGSDETSVLRIERRFPPSPDFLQSIDLRQAGFREVDNHGPSFVLPTDSLSTLDRNLFVWAMRFSHSTTSNGRSLAPSGTAKQFAEYVVTFETDNPFCVEQTVKPA